VGGILYFYNLRIRHVQSIFRTSVETLFFNGEETWTQSITSLTYQMQYNYEHN